MTLFLGGRQVQLRPTTDYNQAVAELRTRSGVRVTCTATTVINSQSDIKDATSMMDTLCSIMSVARGTLVSWTSFEVRSADGVLLHSQYRNSVTRRYTGIELIADDDCDKTKQFLEDGFRKCEDLAEDFKVLAIAHDFIETRDGTFIENRSLRIAVLVEYLANVRAIHEERTHFLQPTDFAAGWKSFEAKAKSALMEIYPDIEKKYLPLMLGNMKGANRRPLKFKIERLATWLGINFSPGEIDKFIRTRDLLAHENSFPDNEDPREHYKRMQHFLDRIILRLFDYHGPYYDFEHGEIRQIGVGKGKE